MVELSKKDSAALEKRIIELEKLLKIRHEILIKYREENKRLSKQLSKAFKREF